MDWNYHVTKLLHENRRFHREYYISLQAFNRLLELLRPSITVDAVKSNASSGLFGTNRHIYPKVILTVSLCWLAGSNLIDSHSSHLWSLSSICLCQMFLDAANSCPVLSIEFPVSNKEKKAVMNGFHEKASIIYFVHALVLKMVIYSQSPNQEKGNVMASLKHIGLGIIPAMSFGLNVQAVCNHSNCCFL